MNKKHLADRALLVELVMAPTLYSVLWRDRAIGLWFTLPLWSLFFLLWPRLSKYYHSINITTGMHVP